MSDMYLDDLRDKTLRGLVGRANAGMLTGGLPYGYRSVPALDEHHRSTGSRVEIDSVQAVVVCRIFALYRDGLSQAAVARLLNDEGVEPPRAHTQHRRKGWIASTIREFCAMKLT